MPPTALTATLLRRLLRPRLSFPTPSYFPLSRGLSPPTSPTSPSSARAMSAPLPRAPAEQSRAAAASQWAEPWRAELWEGTWDSPVPIASAVGASERVVACAGRPGRPHATSYLRVRAGTPTACDHPGCSQVFKLDNSVSSMPR